MSAWLLGEKLFQNLFMWLRAESYVPVFFSSFFGCSLAAIGDLGQNRTKIVHFSCKRGIDVYNGCINADDMSATDYSSICRE